MNETIIKSRDNTQARAARAVREGKHPELIFIEGVRLCAEAISAALLIEEAFLTERFAEDSRHASLLRAVIETGCRLFFVSESVLDSISDTKTPQGIVLIARRPSTEAGVLEQATTNVPLLVVLHRIGNPSNAGSILRTAEAAGASGAIMTANSTDIFSPKTLRGAMGSSFRLPVWTKAEYSEVLAWCQARQIVTVATDASAGRLYSELDWTKPAALIIGTEGSGLTNDEAAQTNEAVRIPMQTPVESLNVGVATAIMLYEAARQRNSFNIEPRGA